MSARFRESEYQLIYALGAGDEKLGVIGNTARAKLKRMPSSMYWAAMGTWNIRNGDLSPDAYFRRQYEYRRLASRTARADDPEARELFPINDLDPHLPTAPDGLLGKVDFTLRPRRGAVPVGRDRGIDSGLDAGVAHPRPAGKLARLCMAGRQPATKLQSSCRT